jgi:hypothetical protein
MSLEFREAGILPQQRKFTPRFAAHPKSRADKRGNSVERILALHHITHKAKSSCAFDKKGKRMLFMKSLFCSITHCVFIFKSRYHHRVGKCQTLRNLIHGDLIKLLLKNVDKLN